MNDRHIHSYTDKDGHFRRKDSIFRDFVSRDPSSVFPAEKGRYVLYANYGCPWAHRTIITRGLKSLESIVDLVLTDFDLTERGWLFSGKNGSAPRDPLYNFSSLSQLYFKVDPEYKGRFTVPVLWDKKNETIVNNESSEIIRMLYEEFDEFLPEDKREINRPGGGFYPENLRQEINDMNEWVYNTVNNGVYKVGFATTQDAYDANLYPLFASLDRLEQHLGQPGHSPFLFGKYITEADIRLYPTMARFDAAYHTIFLCNLKMIRHDYPRLSRWLRNLYWDESERTNFGVFHKTTYFPVYKYGYVRAKLRTLHAGSDEGWDVVLPGGPVPDIYRLTEQEKRDIARELATDVNVEGMTREMQGSGLASKVEFEKATALDEDGDGDATNGNAGAKKSWPEEEDLEGLSAKKQIQRRTTYGDENKKWEKQIKKAQKAEGAPAVHLALS